MITTIEAREFSHFTVTQSLIKLLGRPVCFQNAYINAGRAPEHAPLDISHQLAANASSLFFRMHRQKPNVSTAGQDWLCKKIDKACQMGFFFRTVQQSASQGQV